MEYKQTAEERSGLAKLINAKTMERLMEVTGGEFEATFNDEDKPRKAAYNLKYASDPSSELIEQYNRLIDDTQNEINALHNMLNSKKLDKAKLLKENNKFLAASGEKYSWHKYEQLLANERVAAERIQGLLLKKNSINKLLDEGLTCLIN